MASSEIKLKTLYVMRILLELSDEEHYMTAADISRELGAYGMTADRRSIYSDLEVLERFGLDIVRVSGNRGCYVASREFELPELKILIDAVQVAKFIPQKKSDVLTGKLQQLAGRYAAKELHRQIILSNPSKCEFNAIYYMVDTLHEAMNKNCRVSFQYMEWTERKQERLRHNGKVYEVSPWGLLWNDEYYYLLAYDPEIDGIKHFRVDRMRHISRLEDLGREGGTLYEEYRKGFSTKTFGMYGGDEAVVELKCANHMAGVMIDRFGMDTMMIPKDGGYFTVRVPVVLSPQFFGWLTSVGEDVELVKPASLREEYRAFLTSRLQPYEGG